MSLFTPGRLVRAQWTALHHVHIGGSNWTQGVEKQEKRITITIQSLEGDEGDWEEVGGGQ